ncbi:NUDIX domain-containing protein [Candidatus Saccharibacteria bacterium]|nr:NUDIX domain-containing protein [Candidatus Saccharibacteria bacterium]
MVAPKEVVYKKSAGGVLIHDNKVLLIHWDPPRSTYDFPKGSIDPGESPEDACIREVFEETGYPTRIIDTIGQTYYEYAWTDGTYHKKTVDYFLLEQAGDYTEAQREPHETFAEVWCDITKARELLGRDIDKDLLDVALEKRQATQ